MSLQVFGYSERGMINSIIYEMKYAADGISLLREFLGLRVSLRESQARFQQDQRCPDSRRAVTLRLRRSGCPFPSR